jgi:hypothetical protein
LDELDCALAFEQLAQPPLEILVGCIGVEIANKKHLFRVSVFSGAVWGEHPSLVYRGKLIMLYFGLCFFLRRFGMLLTFSSAQSLYLGERGMGRTCFGFLAHFCDAQSQLQGLSSTAYKSVLTSEKEDVQIFPKRTSNALR